MQFFSSSGSTSIISASQFFSRAFACITSSTNQPGSKRARYSTVIGKRPRHRTNTPSHEIRHWGVDILCRKQSKNAGQANAVNACPCRREPASSQIAFDNKAATGDHRLRHGSNYLLSALPESHSMVHIRQGLHWHICRAKTHALSVHSLSQMSRSCRSCQQSSCAAPRALAASDPRCAVPRIFSFGLQNTATTSFIQRSASKSAAQADAASGGDTSIDRAAALQLERVEYQPIENKNTRRTRSSAG
jgi:hypothetical protein